MAIPSLAAMAALTMLHTGQNMPYTGINLDWDVYASRVQRAMRRRRRALVIKIQAAARGLRSRLPAVRAYDRLESMPPYPSRITANLSMARYTYMWGS